MNEDEDISERVVLAKARTDLASERTRFAAERTLSAWIRTGLASVGVGFAIIHLLVFHTPSHKVLAMTVGEVLIIWGTFIFIFALNDYRKTCKILKPSIHLKSHLWVIITVLTFILLSIFLFIVTIT